MLKLRKTIIYSDLIIFLLIVLCISPFVNKVTEEVITRSISKQAQRLILLLQTATNLDGMIEIMKTNRRFVFEKVSLLSDDGQVIYHSFSPLLLSDVMREHFDSSSPEVEEAIEHGEGFFESFSPVFNEQYAYLARAFKVGGQNYILHLGLTSYAAGEIAEHFKFIFVVLTFLIVLIYGFITWLVVHRMTRPIQQIVRSVSTYQEGKELPRIILDQKTSAGEFSKLAYTLNSLSERIQKQIENLIQQREETETILDALEEGIIATDTNAKVTFINQAASLLMGISKSEILKQRLDQINAKPIDLAKKGHELTLHALQTSDPLIQRWVLRDKEPVYLDLISTPLPKNGALIVIQNKTSDYKMVEMGKDFIANASHELRTPITIIRGFAETLHDLPNLSQEMFKEITEKIVRTCVRLDKLVKSLLTLSDLENLSQERFKKGDLITLAENCKHQLLTSYPDVEVSIETNLEKIPILADPDLLDLAILNLLENGVKYSKGRAHIEMSIFEKGENLHLEIKDHGIGIPEADLARIFERFYTVDKARSRKLGGAGLGLSIVKTIIEKHKGEILASSTLGKGSTFTIILPLQK